MTVGLALVIPWSLFLLGAYLKLSKSIAVPLLMRSQRWNLVLLFALALLVRLVPNFLLGGGARFDIKAFQVVGDLVLLREDVYGNPLAEGLYPYLPLQMYWMAFAGWLSSMGGIPFVKIVRLAPILVDAVLSVLLYFGVAHLTDSVTSSRRAGLLYALNPIPVLVSAYHGQFDVISLLFALLAWYAWISISGRWRRTGWSAFWMGMAILDKSWPVLFLPAMLVQSKSWISRFAYGVVVGGVLVAGVLCYAFIFSSDPVGIVRTAMNYDHGIGVWGYTIFLRELSRGALSGPSMFEWIIHNGRYITLSLLAIAFLVSARKEMPHQAFLTIILTFYAVSHAFSIQYLMWVVPLAILAQDHRHLERYTLAAYAYMLVAYVGLVLEPRFESLMRLTIANRFIIIPLGLPAWLISTHWAVQRLTGSRTDAEG